MRVRVRPEPSWIVIEIEDSGSGIDPRLRKQIFEPFFTTRPTGSGLGLAVVESVVRACGGRVDVRSEPGKGATFILTLPREEIGETDGRTTGAVPDPPRRG